MGSMHICNLQNEDSVTGIYQQDVKWCRKEVAAMLDATSCILPLLQRV